MNETEGKRNQNCIAGSWLVKKFESRLTHKRSGVDCDEAKVTRAINLREDGKFERFVINSLCSVQHFALLCVTDLFAQAIIQSGSPLSFWAVHNDSADLEEYVRLLAVHVSCDSPVAEDMVDCLRALDWTTLMSSICSVRPSYCSQIMHETKTEMTISAKRHHSPRAVTDIR